jgi:hypothetical protein
VVDVVACVQDIGCEKGAAKMYELPDLILYDATKKVLRSAHESGSEETSVVKSAEINGNHLVLQGVENSRGWDVAINTETGQMKGAVVGDRISFLVFGSCASM